MCLGPGGALREEVSPQRLARQPAAFSCVLARLHVSPAAALGCPASRLSPLWQRAEAGNIEPMARMVVPSWTARARGFVSLRLRTKAALPGRTGALYMTEEKGATEKKSPEVINELNIKLWDASEAGDAELIRQLVDEGAEVNSAPFVEDEDDDDDEDSAFSTSVPNSELSAEAAPESSISTDGAVEKIESPKEETPEERKKRKKKEKARKKKLAAANKGPSALHRACEKGHSDAACALVDLGADVNCLMYDLSTPLHLAVSASHKDTVQVLVTLGADLKAKNQLGETPSATGQRAGTSKEVLTFLEQLMELVDPPQ